MAVSGAPYFLLFPADTRDSLEGGGEHPCQWFVGPSYPVLSGHCMHDGGLVESQASTSVSLKWAQELYNKHECKIYHKIHMVFI